MWNSAKLQKTRQLYRLHEATLKLKKVLFFWMENLFRPLNIHFTSLKAIVVVLCSSRMTLVLTIFSYTVDRRSCTIADGWNASKIVLWKIYVIKDSCQCSTSTSSWKISFILMDEPSETGKMHIASQRATAIVDEVLVLYEKTFFGWSIVAGPRRIRHLSMLMKTLCIFSFDTSNFPFFSRLLLWRLLCFPHWPENSLLRKWNSVKFGWID